MQPIQQTKLSHLQTLDVVNCVRFLEKMIAVVLTIPADTFHFGLALSS